MIIKKYVFINSILIKNIFKKNRKMIPSRCTFQIPRGETNRYVFVFNYFENLQGYKVTLKVLMANKQNYTKVSTVFVPQTQVMNYINTTVALTY
jgi:hypothetical protein